MPFRKKALYYGIMLLLTLLALEGMARLAWYAAYGPGYGGGWLSPGNFTPAAPATPNWIITPGRINHPFYGYTDRSPGNALYAMPPRQRREDTALIALLGGSVANQVKPYLQRELNRYFAANNLPRQPLVLDLAVGGMKQPQQTLIIANALLLGGEFDLIINLDGLNELNGSAENNFKQGLFPFFPKWWERRTGLTAEEILLAGRLNIRRQDQSRLAAVAANSPWGRSALFRLANRYQQERNAAEILRLNYELAATGTAYSLEKHGPRGWLATEGELWPAAARVWYRGSAVLARLAELHGADYYHFLQPNQYVPGAKPLSPAELEYAYDPLASHKFAAERGYPLLLGFSSDLQGQGIPFFDLTRIFADHPETLYSDTCCHLNERGNELLAAAMVARLEPALLRRGGARAAGPVSALAAGRRPGEAAGRPAGPEFQVSLPDDGKDLRYIREVCRPEDIYSPFFLHLIPRDLAALPRHRQEYGFDQQDFDFLAAGGRFAGWQCAVLIRLPDYPIAEIRTGQTGLWQATRYPPAAPEQLRAAYAALADIQPAARAVFDLYWPDNRLIYLRETCAVADTAADFFLHIVPENPADLPEERRPAGFAHRGFAFAGQGGHFDGKCLATVSLPDYAIKAMRTGQYVPGQGELWSAGLKAAP